MGFGGSAPKQPEAPAPAPKEKPKQKSRGGFFGAGVPTSAANVLNSANTRRGAFLGG